MSNPHGREPMERIHSVVKNGWPFRLRGTMQTRARCPCYQLPDTAIRRSSQGSTSHMPSPGTGYSSVSLSFSIPIRSH
jgi:hypothetical protein